MLMMNLGISKIMMSLSQKMKQYEHSNKQKFTDKSKLSEYSPKIYKMMKLFKI